MHELTLEQRFLIRSFADQTRSLNREQAIDLLVQLYSQMIQKDAICRDLLRQQWGIEDGPKSA
jgi:hypothetical protein